MTWPTTIIIDCVFIPLYLALLVLNVFNMVKHGHRKTVGFFSLFLVSILHLVGNFMLVVENGQHDASVTVVVWGFILQSVGLSPLISSGLAFYSRARSSLQHNDDGGKREARLSRLLNLVNIAALVCIITGYTSTTFVDAQGRPLADPKLPVQTKVGAVLYVLLTATLVGLTLVGLKDARTGGQETRVIRTTLAVATPLMVVRAAFAAYTTFSGTILVPKSIWAKLVLQYVTELAALAVLTSVGFLIEKPALGRSAYDVERVESDDGPKHLTAWNGPGSMQYQPQQAPAQVPMAYPPPPQGRY